MTLVLCLPIIKKNLIMHELRNNLNFYCSKSGNLYLRHYSNRSSEDFLLKIDIRNVRGHMKTCPCPSHTACNKYSFTPYRGHQVKTFWTRYMCKYQYVKVNQGSSAPITKTPVTCQLHVHVIFPTNCDFQHYLKRIGRHGELKYHYKLYKYCNLKRN